jgi:PII-like signaling protein
MLPKQGHLLRIFIGENQYGRVPLYQWILPEIDQAIGHGLATIEKVEVRFYPDGGWLIPLRASPHQSQGLGARAPLSDLLLTRTAGCMSR